MATLLCPVCSMMARSDFPAAAEVARPARRLWPAKTAGSYPSGSRPPRYADGSSLPFLIVFAPADHDDDAVRVLRKVLGVDQFGTAEGAPLKPTSSRARSRMPSKRRR
jgi:hypothetical protein